MKIASDVYGYKTAIANIALVGGLGKDKQDWVLVDAGIPYSAKFILQYAKSLFGKKKPIAIILTHGHFDHIGALETLLHEWDVPIYAHSEEMSYLTGEEVYPRPTPFVVKGVMSFLSPFYPRDGIQLHSNLKVLQSGEELNFMEGWECIHTPGHTKGHISLYRKEDGLLLAGDAFVTVKQESLFAVLTQKEELHGPPAYFTPNRAESRESIMKLAKLEPSIIYTGHGKPLYGKEQIAKGLYRLIRHYDVGFAESPTIV
ncbi:MBL fold metallo-hydrolase [Niallia taxi]|uniref:MBL fold metallo-hydrolase n=1 Tax=Niallia taxi TaxID=2499688 RepID=A0A3S2TUJ7_9BACI|nr:MBL fold metallo-hydrolase [Niallia taxi]RVT57797.1 MBL fold metallo-hydrolase [Niallia taxi]